MEPACSVRGFRCRNVCNLHFTPVSAVIRHQVMPVTSFPHLQAKKPKVTAPSNMPSIPRYVRGVQTTQTDFQTVLAVENGQ